MHANPKNPRKNNMFNNMLDLEHSIILNSSGSLRTISPLFVEEPLGPTGPNLHLLKLSIKLIFIEILPPTRVTFCTPSLLFFPLRTLNNSKVPTCYSGIIPRINLDSYCHRNGKYGNFLSRRGYNHQAGCFHCCHVGPISWTCIALLKK